MIRRFVFGRGALLGAFSHRTLALLRWDLYFLRLRGLNALKGQRRKIARLLADRPRPLYLNLGSGPRGLADAHWVNVDGFRDKNVDLLLDLSRPLPFPGGTFDGVFSEHVVEHFSLEDGEALAREVLRMLRPGGVFRCIVPDGAWILRSYFDGDWRGRDGGRAPMEAVNDYFRQRYEHQYIYDADTMARMLKRAGFSRVETAAFQGGSALSRLDDIGYAPESLYVDAYVSAAASSDALAA